MLDTMPIPTSFEEKKRDYPVIFFHSYGKYVVMFCSYTQQCNLKENASSIANFVKNLIDWSSKPLWTMFESRLWPMGHEYLD